MTKNQLPSVDDVPDFTKPVASVTTEDEPKSPPPPKYKSEALRELALDHQAMLEEADELLREIHAEGRKPQYAELLFFREKCGWSEQEVKRQMRRMNNVILFEGIAGTPESRAAAAKEAAKSAEVLAEQGPKLQAEIEKLQAKLRSYEADARLAQKRTDQQVEAVSKLRELTPAHIAEKYNTHKRLIKGSLGKEFQEGEIRVNELECLLDPQRYESEQDYLEALRRSCFEAVTDAATGGMQRLVHSAEWPTIKEKLEKELAKLKPEVAKLRVDFERELAANEATRDYYGC